MGKSWKIPFTNRFFLGSHLSQPKKQKTKRHTNQISPNQKNTQNNINDQPLMRRVSRSYVILSLPQSAAQVARKVPVQSFFSGSILKDSCDSSDVVCRFSCPTGFCWWVVFSLCLFLSSFLESMDDMKNTQTSIWFHWRHLSNKDTGSELVGDNKKNAFRPCFEPAHCSSCCKRKTSTVPTSTCLYFPGALALLVDDHGPPRHAVYGRRLPADFPVDLVATPEVKMNTSTEKEFGLHKSRVQVS